MRSSLDYHAIHALFRTFEICKKTLLPFNAGFWFKLFLIVFIGGISFANQFYFTLPSTIKNIADFQNAKHRGTYASLGEVFLAALKGKAFIVFIFIGILIFLFLILFRYINSLFHFIFLESLIKKDVKFIEFARENAFKSLKLFIFRFFLGILIISPTIIFFGFFFGGIILKAPYLAIPGFAFAIFSVFLSAFIAGILNMAIIDFIIPLMLFKDYGIIYGFKRIASIFSSKEELKQGLVYLGVRFLIAVVAGIGISIISIFFLISFIIQSKIMGALIFAGYIIAAFILYIASVNFIVMTIYAYIRLYSVIFLSNYEYLGDEIKGAVSWHASP